jgi:CBS domain-containing protein
VQARQVMSSPVVTVRPGTTVRDAAALLLEHRITAAPVLDGTGGLVGIVSEGDLVGHRFGHDPRSHVRPVEDEPAGPRTVGEVMTTTVVTLGPSADAADLAATMLAADVRSIPIVDGDAVLGIVSRRDLLRTLVRADADIRADVLARLAPDRASTDDWDAEVTDGEVTLLGHYDEPAGRAALAVTRTVPGVLAARLGAGSPPRP